MTDLLQAAKDMLALYKSISESPAFMPVGDCSQECERSPFCIVEGHELGDAPEQLAEAIAKAEASE